jgi:hypothetical protein
MARPVTRAEFDYRDNHWRLIEDGPELRLEIRLGGQWQTWTMLFLGPLAFPDVIEDDDGPPDER